MSETTPRVRVVEPGTEWTARNGKCGHCGKEEHGYAKKVTQGKDKGKWKPSCWPCVKPAKEKS